MAEAKTPRRARPVEPIEIPERTWFVWAISINLLIALTRVLALRNSPFDLLPDEAQYWSWSRHLAFGYFSKPPMIAWLIAGTTAAVGDDEWGVRLAAPLMHAATGIIVAAIGRAMFGARAGFFAALLYALLPGVIFSGLVISTDVPLLFFWAVALWAFWQVWSGGDWRWAAMLGIAFGLGFLSKYAMAYFLLGAVIFVWLAPRRPLRAVLRHFAVSLTVAVAIILPNLIWNARHGWATVGHTAANANWGQGGGMHLVEAAAFAAAQLGVFGPILLVALVARLVLLKRDPPSEAERYLLAFSAPILLLMILQSGISRAHANWAAVSYVSAIVLIVGWLDRRRLFWAVQLSFALQLAVFAAFTTLFAGALTVRLPKTVDILHQMRGWHSLSQLVLHRLDTAPEGSAVAADDREVMAELDYYLRNRPFPLLMATGEGPPGNQYELENPITAGNGEHVLLVARYPDRKDILDKFTEQKLAEEWTVSAGQGRTRRYFVYELGDFKGG